jgi:hypothetical protein
MPVFYVRIMDECIISLVCTSSPTENLFFVYLRKGFQLNEFYSIKGNNDCEISPADMALFKVRVV